MIEIGGLQDGQVFLDGMRLSMHDVKQATIVELERTIQRQRTKPAVLDVRKVTGHVQIRVASLKAYHVVIGSVKRVLGQTHCVATVRRRARARLFNNRTGRVTLCLATQTARTTRSRCAIRIVVVVT